MSEGTISTSDQRGDLEILHQLQRGGGGGGGPLPANLSTLVERGSCQRQGSYAESWTRERGRGGEWRGKWEVAVGGGGGEGGSRYCGNFVMKWLLFRQKRFYVSLRYRRGTPLPRARLSDYYVDSVWDPGSARRLLFDNYVDSVCMIRAACLHLRLLTALILFAL